MSLSNLAKSTQGQVRTSGVSDFMELELSLIYPNPAQPRKSFNDIDELSESIKEHGLIQPIAVAKDGSGKYMIISGERRYRASKLAGLKTIKAHIVTANSKAIEEISLIENIQRNDLTDFEVANYITALWNSGQYPKKQDLAKALGKKPAYISKALGLIDKLDETIKEDISNQKLNVGLSVLEELSRVKEKDVQKILYDQLINKEITRNEIKEKAQALKQKEPNIEGKSFTRTQLDNTKQSEMFTGENETAEKNKEGTAFDESKTLSDAIFYASISTMLEGSVIQKKFPSWNFKNDKYYSVFLRELEAHKELEVHEKLIFEFDSYLLGSGANAIHLSTSRDNKVPNIELRGFPDEIEKLLPLFKSSKKYKITIEEV